MSQDARPRLPQLEMTITMNFANKLTLTALASAAVLFGTVHALPSQGAAIAAGAGIFNPGPDARTFSFNVVELPDGSVNGHSQIYVHSGTGSFIHIDVTSYGFEDDLLIVAGPVTKSVGSPFPLGTIAFFAVEDNGEGNPSLDRVTTAGGDEANPWPDVQALQAFLAQIGASFTDLSGEPVLIDQGNIQIH